MPPQPYYSTADPHPAYHLRYTWCGWPSQVSLLSLSDEAWKGLSASWERDGLRLLERSLEHDCILITFSAKPDVNPVFVAQRAKGRLDHACRETRIPCEFSRKVAVRSIGDNIRDEVEQYIRNQVPNEDFVDPRFGEFLSQFTVTDPWIDLSLPTESNSGRYWYNLHLVLVIDGRCRITDESSLRMLRDRSLTIAKKKGYRISTLSVMPDHLHVALRGDISASPQEIALAFQNNLAHAIGRGMIWRPGYYAGTFGEYNMNAVRRGVSSESASPVTRGDGGRTSGEAALQLANLSHPRHEVAGVVPGVAALLSARYFLTHNTISWGPKMTLNHTTSRSTAS